MYSHFNTPTRTYIRNPGMVQFEDEDSYNCSARRMRKNQVLKEANEGTMKLSTPYTRYKKERD